MTAADESTIEIESPVVADGSALHRIATDSQVLDVNSRYAYVLWCRDFAATSVVARRGADVVGFVTGYRRPDRPDVLFVWQVAVDAAARGGGVAGRMLDALVARVPGVTTLETTVTDDNAASRALFAAFAARHGAQVERSELFGDVLGPQHEPEILHRISPIDRGMVKE
ncbi:diaminobutyrate acetyltransferase [Pseudonocardia sp. CA-107938]|uniref:diaminobutyrate acetyltransferase n=1 Tax=Pseudonocardia sp. CA-107938 TaxID=3240021 RepID=UPI003D8FC77A